MDLKRAAIALAGFITGLVALTTVATAEDRVGMAVEKQLGFQPAASPVMEEMIQFHDLILMPIITVIALFVIALILYVMFRFSAKRNPQPSTTTHNTFIEVVWTLVPVIILMVIAIPSFRLLYKQDVMPDADVVINVTGITWNWDYEYPDEGISFNSAIVATADEWPEAARDIQGMLGRSGELPYRRLLDVNTRVVVPVDQNVVMNVTAADVIHAWTIPAFGAKVDAVPGRINQLWFRATETGTYYGQCSELCGVGHAYMPIAVEVVSAAEYNAWLSRAKEQYASSGAVQLADAR